MAWVTRTIQVPREVNVAVCDECGTDLPGTSCYEIRRNYNPSTDRYDFEAMACTSECLIKLLEKDKLKVAEHALSH